MTVDVGDIAARCANPAFLVDVLEGLAQEQKAVPARWLYDHRGSELFEEITDIPEYYPTRTEIDLLKAHSAEIGRHAGPRVVVEFGSGSSKKTPLLLGAIDPLAYVPIDISGSYLRQSAHSLGAMMPELDIVPVEADFTHPLRLPGLVDGLPKLGFFPGSTVGNLTPGKAVALLQAIGDTLGGDSMLLIGMDLVKPLDILLPAYDDAAGVTAEFNVNLLNRINRELDGDIPIDAFRHEARWNMAEKRIEMHLVAERAIAFHVAEHEFSMESGESIHSENSHKYTKDDAHFLLRAGGWTPIANWSDAQRLFSLHLARRTTPSVQD